MPHPFRPFSLLTALVLSILCSRFAAADQPIQNAKPNILIVTVDDMSCDSIGAFGCKLDDTSPNIDELAKRGMRYEFAHVQVGNCMPCRNVMFSGRYPHNNGVEGFYQVKEPKHPFMVELMQQAGYFVGIRGKVTHSTPYHPYPWDADMTSIDGEKQDNKNANSYYRSTKLGIELAEKANKPFCLNINISDPHKPFVKMNRDGTIANDPNVPSRLYKPDEVPIPGYLIDHPDVRFELAQYYSSVRRADDCFGEIMRALKESGKQESTVVIFLSDHGMPLPFAKTQLYHHSTRTPWIVHWPGVTKPGSIDREHMISVVDMVPTLLEIAGADQPDGLDGNSFLPTIHGENQSNRQWVYKVYNENSGGSRQPIRGVQSKKFLYLFNPWSDEKRLLKGATLGTATYKTMQKVAKTDKAVAARLKLFNYRIPEEFYDVENDPDCLNNLIDDPKFATALSKHRTKTEEFMVNSNDPMLAPFQKRDDAEFVSDYVDQLQAASDARRVNKRKKNRNNKKSTTVGTKQNQKLFTLKVPDAVAAGRTIDVVIKHNLPTEVGSQKFHVTLKGSSGNRIQRKVVEATGKGSFDIQFDLPEDFSEAAVGFAAFVGEDYQSNLLHRSKSDVPVNK